MPARNDTPRPLSDRVIVEPLEGQVTYDRPGPLRGRVISVGRLVVELEVGDVVWFGRFCGSQLDYDDVSYVVMREDEVLAIAQKSSQN